MGHKQQTIGAVSYTHLDVYKRQVQDCEWRGLNCYKIIRQ